MTAELGTLILCLRVCCEADRRRPAREAGKAEVCRPADLAASPQTAPLESAQALARASRFGFPISIQSASPMSYGAM